MSIPEDGRRSPWVRADELEAVDEWFSRELHYAVGTDAASGRHYVSFPVTIGAVDYEEFYELDDAQHRAFLADPALALPFVEACRRREHDELLMVKPGWNRGIPY